MADQGPKLCWSGGGGDGGVVCGEAAATITADDSMTRICLPGATAANRHRQSGLGYPNLTLRLQTPNANKQTSKQAKRNPGFLLTSSSC